MTQLTSAQREAIDAPFEGSLAIVGPAGSGKSTALIERARRAVSLAGEREVLVLAPAQAPLAPLRARLDGAARCTTIGAFAATLLRATIVDDAEAELHFARSARPLLALEWPEFSDETLDPEVPGLRAPQRFLEAAFRLFRKLRDAQLSPEAFLESAQRGATAFYAKPPNFANADLLYYTKDAYRDSLDVDAEELRRQFRHESHLAKILARLYRAYVDDQTRDGMLTARDAIAEATASLRDDPARASGVRAGLFAILVDEAQEMTLGELLFLQALAGEGLDGVTLAGDPHGAAGSFRGARPDRVFPAARTHVALERRLRAPLSNREPAMHLRRESDQRAEARYIADEVADRLRAGAAPDRIAVIFRSVENVRAYEEALLARGVPVQVIGDVNVFRDPRALDALALLWNVHDPFRHDWLLRTLCAPATALSDATLGLLCGEPPDAQTLLFETDEPPAQPRARWDLKRDLRLGWNVLRGDADAHLSEVARARVTRFRELRAGWVEAERALPLPELARLIWSEGLAQLGEPESARARAQQLVLRRLLARMQAFCERHPEAALGDFLEDAESRARSELEACEDLADEGAVRLLSVEAARGLEFAHVIVANVRPGAFPRWYVPDAFLYSPTQGMIAKENVGDARAARTAKFSYYVYRTKTRERYNDEERRTFAYALSRARESLVITAWGAPTRGVTAPEFLEELRAARAESERRGVS